VEAKVLVEILADQVTNKFLRMTLKPKISLEVINLEHKALVALKIFQRMILRLKVARQIFQEALLVFLKVQDREPAI